MTRIVLDSNVLGRGQFSVKSLRQWIDAAGEGEVEIFIPEVVLWEWAEHACAAYDSLVQVERSFSVDPLVYARPSVPAPLKKEEVLDRIEKAMPREITIWRPAANEWRAAVKAQTLQAGTGEKKGGVKTGATDHIVLACVDEQVRERGTTEAVLLVSNDKRLQRVAAEHNPAVLSVGSKAELLRRLINFIPPEEDLAEAVEEAIVRRVSDSRSDIGTALTTFEMGFEVAVTPDRSSGWAGRELAGLRRVDTVEVHRLRVADTITDVRVGLADVRIFGDVHMTVLEPSEAPNGDFEWTQTFSGTVSGGSVDLTLEVRLDRHWELQSVSAAGIARIDFDSGDDDQDQSDNQ